MTASGDDLVLVVVEFDRRVGEVFADCEAKEDCQRSCMYDSSYLARACWALDGTVWELK